MHTVVVQTSLFGLDVSMWLQHLVLVPQLYSEATLQVHYWQTVHMALWL